VLNCQGCRDSIIVVEKRLLRDTGLHDWKWTGTLWWPTPGSDGVDDSVPAEVAGAFEEGVRCIGVQAPHAAVAMFRTSLAHIVEDKGSEEARAKKDLFHSVERMVEDRTLWDSFGTWASHIRTTGNAGAHPEKFEPVTMAQATDMQGFIRQLIEFLYIQPARLSAAMPVTRKST
jgi:hypothetical protein